MEGLRNEKEKILLNVEEEKNEQSKLKELEELLDNQELQIESYDEELVRKLVEKIVVYEEKLKVIFKSELEIDIDKQQICNGSVFTYTENGDIIKQSIFLYL